MEIRSDDVTAVSPEEAHERVHALALSTAGHPAVRNAFYELWMAGPLPAGHVEVVARNYLERVRRTPDRIALAFLSTTDVAARAEIVANLSDEMGHGDPARVHSVILRGFFETLLSRLRGHPVRLDDLTTPLLPSTVRLVEQSEKLFASPHPQESLGALLAQEWHAYPQLVFLYEGVRNYRDLFELTEFHEACEYFYLHIGATEKEHKLQALSTAARTCRTTADLAHLERGFTGYLELLADNWAELHRAVRPA
ncbi:iron-containing redox enzyme family protein [Longispora sp. NPDC051575]|uniref:iron-containing redox enzyme family protein n=1 Tax=Longispora sp. NPDC051575 TaxID=3154943 RepID=UPI00342E1A5E